MENNLKVYRAMEDITQGELADRVGVSRQTMNSIETNRYDPSLELAFKLSREFDCDIKDLFEYDSNGSE